MNGDLLRAVALSLAVSAVVVLGFAAALAVVALDFADTPGLAEVAATFGLIVALALLWHVFGLVRRHLRGLERLRGGIVTLAGNAAAVLPPSPAEAGQVEIERLHAAVADFAARVAGERAAPDRRLEAVLASIPDAMVVITEAGQVSLVNFAGRTLLGAERVRVGTSVFAALERDGLLAALARARSAGAPLETELETLDGERLHARVARLGAHGGALLSFPAAEVEHHALIEHDLGLHDQPPPSGPFSDYTPLSELPLTVLDTETTGLDAAADRVVSVAAVRLHGGRIYRGAAFDRLVDPGIPIPPRSTAVHGITNAMLADAAPFAKVFSELRPFLQGTVLLGHHVSFDLTVLGQECRRSGVAWTVPPCLDTLLLAASLDPELPGHNLESLAGFLGVDVQGRHTALGDCLVTAEVFARLLPRLADAGITTLGAAVAVSRRADRLVQQQPAG